MLDFRRDAGLIRGMSPTDTISEFSIKKSSNESRNRTPVVPVRARVEAAYYTRRRGTHLYIGERFHDSRMELPFAFHGGNEKILSVPVLPVYNSSDWRDAARCSAAEHFDNPALVESFSKLGHGDLTLRHLCAKSNAKSQSLAEVLQLLFDDRS